MSWTACLQTVRPRPVCVAQEGPARDKGPPGSEASWRAWKWKAYLLQTMEMATSDTTNTTPAAAEPAIKGSCSLSSDL